ncbi:ATP-binding protein [Pseudaminobacter salicylatoxidans]|uniref:ATP-binding protein n=1 Tax=Pseudaminobacter salicylatoxidans TaxID=93369 RepID=UPI00244E4AD5|nr:ATP-binding protein [Pseudaminobacter salicylatoxidans]
MGFRREATRQNYNVQFVITSATLVAMLAKARSDGSLDKQLTIPSRPKLLIIDEAGYLPFETNVSHLFFQPVSRRDTANAWAAISPDQTLVEKTQHVRAFRGADRGMAEGRPGHLGSRRAATAEGNRSIPLQ